MRLVRAKTFITFHVTLYIAQHALEMKQHVHTTDFRMSFHYTESKEK